MSALDAIERVSSSSLLTGSLLYCLVDEKKIPYKIDGTNASPNQVKDFVPLEELLMCPTIDKYKGIGISIQASTVCAIDVDHCFSIPFDVSSGDERAKNIIHLFENKAYIEFSFSGKGLRILFYHDVIKDYSNRFYIKNEAKQIEFYQPSNSFRYVTITGKSICDTLSTIPIADDILFKFLNEYMVRPSTNKIIPLYERKEREDRPVETLLKITKNWILKDFSFQELWFSRAPGYGADESERDFRLVSYLYERVTSDEEKIRILFEESPYFKSKDYAHMKKWKNNDYFYYHYIYKKIVS